MLLGPHSDEFEWPTWALVLGIYASWGILLNYYYQATPVVTAPILVYVMTLHSSLCHEVLHGHPTRIRWLNDLLVQLPVGLLVPYFTFKESHLRHHRDDVLTLPGVDPESFFTRQADWNGLNRMTRQREQFRMTLLGRFLLDPGIKFGKTLQAALDDLKYRRWTRVMRYAAHFTLATAVILMVVYTFGVPLWHYLLIAYGSNSLLQLRSFYEHRPVVEEKKRSVIVESGPLLRLLFLNNNFHAVHHRYPKMAWYQIAGEYRSKRQDYLGENGNFLFKGYHHWAKFLVRPVNSPVHPFA